jgi:hypothetical protein
VSAVAAAEELELELEQNMMASSSGANAAPPNTI